MSLSLLVSHTYVLLLESKVPAYLIMPNAEGHALPPSLTRGSALVSLQDYLDCFPTASSSGYLLFGIGS